MVPISMNNTEALHNITVNISKWLNDKQSYFSEVSNKSIFNKNRGVLRPFNIITKNMIIDCLSKYSKHMFSEESKWSSKSINGFFLVNGYIDEFIESKTIKLIDYAVGYGIIKELSGIVSSYDASNIDYNNLSDRHN